jgi:tetratricopeptide (TPR) repeat protein
MMRHRNLAVVLVALLAGCVINQRTASNYYEWGSQAEMSGNYALAERNYERALINARLGHSPDEGLSAVTYNLGRIKGYLCKYNEAEKLLTEALTLEEKVKTPQNEITQRLFELARFYSDRGIYQQSLPYFARAIPAVKKLGVESSDPIALAEVLEEYAVALNKTG